MKISNDVLTQSLNQEQIDSLSKSAEAQIDRAEEYNQQASAGKAASYVQANVEFFVTISGNRGNCYGWIHYLDGRKLRFFGQSIKSVGGPVQMKTNQLITTMVLPYEVLVGNPILYKASGLGISSGGELSMTCLKVPVTPYPLELFGTAIISWQTEGEGRFTRN